MPMKYLLYIGYSMYNLLQTFQELLAFTGEKLKQQRTFTEFIY